MTYQIEYRTDNWHRSGPTYSCGEERQVVTRDLGDGQQLVVEIERRSCVPVTIAGARIERRQTGPHGETEHHTVLCLQPHEIVLCEQRAAV